MTIGLILIVISICAVVITVTNQRTVDRLTEGSTMTHGQVTEIRESKNPQEVRVYFEYQASLNPDLADTETFEGIHVLPNTTEDTVGLQVGDTIDVLYFDDDPQQSYYLKRNQPHNQVYIYYISAILFAIGVYFMLTNEGGGF